MRHVSLAVIAVAMLSACADSPTSPTNRAPAVPPTDAAPILNLTPLSKYANGTYAAALKANVLGLTARAGEAGPTGPGGGSESNSALTIGLPNVLWTSVLNGEVWANQYHSYAKASVDELKLNLVGLQLRATVLKSEAVAGCGPNKPYGSSSIVGLTINGKPIVITGAPNQTIPLLVGKVVINEQQPYYNGIRIRALHVTVLGVADVAVAESAAPLFYC